MIDAEIIAYLDKHPCPSCGAGYGACIEGWSLNLKCCADCSHPGRLVEEPYTAAELVAARRRFDARQRSRS